MAEVNQLSEYNSYSSDSSSYSSSQEAIQPLQLPLEQNANAPPQQPPQRQPTNENRVLVKTMLITLGFQNKYIEKAIRTYEKTYGTEHYSQDEIIQIILRLQDKAELKQKNANIAAMNLDPQVAEELFGKKYKSKSSKKGKKKSKSSGYRPGQVVIYRNKLEVQILDNLDDYVQVCWPLKKSFYKRAVLWVNVSNIAKREKKKKAKKIAQEKEQDKKLFGGIFSSKSSSKSDDPFGSFSKYDKHFKSEYKYEKIWKNMIVQEFEDKKPAQNKISENEKKIMLKMYTDDDDEKEPEVPKKVVKMEKNKQIFAQLKQNPSGCYEFMQETKEKFNILSKFEVQNETIFDLFCKRKALILQHSLDGDDSKLNIRTLWYSCSRNQVSKILNFGFKRKYGSAHSFGFGFKMYKNANDAINGFGDYQQHKVKSDDDVQYLMQCDVICGESCLGVQNGAKLPPAKPSKSYILFETSVHSMFENNNKYFIIHQDHQAMPLNVICFKERAKLKLKKKQIKFASPRKSKLKPKRRDFDPQSFLQQYHAQQQQQQPPPQAPLPAFGFNVNPQNVPPLPPQQVHAAQVQEQQHQRFMQRAQRRRQQQQQQPQQAPPPVHRYNALSGDAIDDYVSE